LGRGIARDLLRVGDPAVPRSVTGLGETDAMRVTGFVGRPTLTRANRALQHFYVNGRSVRSPLFYKALDNAFRSTMPHGRHPVALLFIDVPPGAVDVNVHPAKTEVRFQDEGAIHEAVLRAVQEALRTDPAQGANPVLPGTSRASRVEEPAAFAPEAPPAGTPLPFADSAIGGPSPQERYRTWSRGAPGAGGPEEVDPFEHLPSGRSETSGGRPSWSPGTPARTPFPEPSPDTSPGYRWSAPAPSEPEPTPRSEAIPPAELARQPEPAIPELRLLGQSQDLFILAEGGGRLWIIDQHVAHERVLFDRMTSEGARRDPSEALLIPATLEVDRAQALALEEHRALLGDLGFEVEPFGRSRYVLRSVPRTLLGRNYEAVFRDLADELTERTQGGQVKLRRDEVALAAAGRSCKSAVKAGQKLGTTEVVRLLEDLRHARHPHTCPHGRPVFLTLDEDEVAQLFGGRDCD
ncbi:MAG: mismatch repair protein MutL, partial [Armatimonadetes bacterium]|nr:mismatch repair protein MutL [Armatimonadota bacterium]